MEIKLSTLRIGNLILDPYGEITEVTFGIMEYLHRYETAKKENIDVGKCNYSKLPLSRELIEDLGYIMDEDNGDEAYYTKGGFGIKWVDENEFYFFKKVGVDDEYSIIVEVCTADSLQNIHFIMTGKELIYKKK